MQTATATDNQNVVPKLTLPAATLPDAVVGDAYSFQYPSATGGVTPYKYAATGLADGLTMDPATALITGTPTGLVAGSPITVATPTSVVVTVTDATAN
jgi:large repetitive protein